MFKHSTLLLGYLGFRRVQSPPRRANGIVVEEVERHGCRESRDGPWMAHRGGPLERRWSERTLAQPGPDDRAEGFGYFCPTKVTRPGRRNQKHQQKRGNLEQTPNNQQAITQTCQSGIKTDFPNIPRSTFFMAAPGMARRA
ncbi:hypothetical protein [Pseudomonas sp. AA-38]|uniref:hypothetical protein n=1 Tax=Pseudomonas sp. AA-38 TaxID=3028807 RepID=UPI0023F9B839|nr:hypothetical protein [Pseudomonas sp. AA-38]